MADASFYLDMHEEFESAVDGSAASWENSQERDIILRSDLSTNNESDSVVEEEARSTTPQDQQPVAREKRDPRIERISDFNASIP